MLDYRIPGPEGAMNVPSLQTVHDLEPLIARQAAAAEESRRMQPEVIEALREAGLFRLWVPREFGGYEMDPDESLVMMEELARIDPAAGWVVSNCSLISTVTQMASPAAQAEILFRPDVVTCGSFVPAGPVTSVREGDSYRVTGTWAFGSGVHYATSIAANTVLSDANGPVLGPDGSPVVVVAYLTPDQLEIHDTWRTLGLRATGSTTFSAKDVLVPDGRAAIMAPMEPSGPWDRPLYRIGFIIDAARIGAVGIGIAEGALRETVALALSKVPAYTAVVTADRPTVQERVARAQALIQAGRDTVHAAAGRAMAAVAEGPRLSGPGIVPLGLASAFALDAAVQAVDLLYEVAGTTGFQDESSIQKRFRDLQTLRQNAITSWSRYESLGKLVLGRPSDWPLHNL
jgi:alkylation response protein AidB-like acyl-CoA dehydrogenase